MVESYRPSCREKGLARPLLQVQYENGMCFKGRSHCFFSRLSDLPSDSPKPSLAGVICTCGTPEFMFFPFTQGRKSYMLIEPSNWKRLTDHYCFDLISQLQKLNPAR